MKWHRLNERYGASYQSAPKCGSGIGRFQVHETDNANARAIGRRPKWTVHDLYTHRRYEADTLAECAEWATKQEGK